VVPQPPLCACPTATGERTDGGAEDGVLLLVQALAKTPKVITALIDLPLFTDLRTPGADSRFPGLSPDGVG
jgi:hypothetical protein